MQAKDKFWCRNFLDYPSLLRGKAKIGVACATLFSSAARLCASDPATNLSFASTQETTSWSVSYKGHKVIVYSCAGQNFKPYVKELYTLNANNIIRDAPNDHLHHHGLMFAIKVNGINFWEEISGSGVEKVIQTEQPTLGFVTSNGKSLPRATLAQLIHWVGSQDAFLPDSAAIALLVEHRTLHLTIDPSNEEVALEWNSQFEVGGKTNTVMLSGSIYHGLGVRFRQELDALAQHSVAGMSIDLSNKGQDLSTAKWASVSFAAPAQSASLIMAGAPANPHGDATFFSMRAPFAYLSATEGLDKQPLLYHTGDKFELKYLVLVYPGVESQDRIERRVQAWRESSK